MKEGIIYGLFGGLIGSLYMGWICSPPSKCQHACFAVVDMQALIFKKSQQLAKRLEEKNNSSQIAALPGADKRIGMQPTQEPSNSGFPARVLSIRETGDYLREGLKTFATTHNLILLAKGAVIGGDLPDKTEEILAWFDDTSASGTSVNDTSFGDAHTFGGQP